jgi:alpha-beta hydrolase superfamily lysophospholipase
MEETRSQINIHIHEWKPEVTPTCVVVIAHGMGEHGGRYSQLAQQLTAQGYMVYAPDHRGHGRTAGSKVQFGHFADHNGWNLVIEDLRAVIEQVHIAYPRLPIVLFGHSMGSLISRRYIQLYGDRVHGVILSGTSGDPGVMGNIGKLIAQWEIKKSGLTTHSPLLTKLLFGGFNKKFRPSRTPYDWLTRDPKEIDQYISDEWVGMRFSAGFFYDLITGVNELNKPQELHRTPRHLPILIFSGDQDPVGNFTKGVVQTYNRFRKIGSEDVTLKIYKGARHELINELNREEVFSDIINWIRTKAPIS